MNFSSKFKDFLMTRSQQEKSKEVQDERYAQYNITPNSFTTSLSLMRSVNDMLLDPIISSCVALQMETAFQTDDDQRIFSVESKSRVIEKELEAFHKDIDMQNQALLYGYNLILWGNLPIEHKFDSSKKLIGITPLGDFTKVVPIIISGVVAGYLVDDEYHFPFEYTYAQSQHYKNLGGPYSSVASYVTQGDVKVVNEFVYSPSYLTSAAKAWRNVNIIEDALLLARMDQSNYYRIIGVDVGGSVYSKGAIKVLNYYRNLFKKVRKVSYDPAGMSARGTNQEFEVIVPKSGTQGVSVDDVGGHVNVEALKDLDAQYNKLFAALRVNPSMIGFSSDTPGTLNGEGPGLLWDERFGKLCRALLHSVFRAVRNIDVVFLRSRGYSVEGTEWNYRIPALTMLADRQNSALLESSVKTLESLTRQFRDNELEYDKKYLFKKVLGGALAASGVDIEDLFNVETAKEPTVIGSSYYSQSVPLTASESAVLKESFKIEFGDSEKKVLIASSTEGMPTVNEILFQSKVYPENMKVDCSALVHPVKSNWKTDGIIPRELELVNVPSSIIVPKNLKLDFTVKEVNNAAIGCIDEAFYIKGSLVLTKRQDVLTYLALVANDMKTCLISKFYLMKE